MLKPRVVRVADRRCAKGPTRILAKPLTAPIGYVERRIGEDVIETQVLEFVLVKATFIIPSDVGVDAAHSKVHFAQPPCRVIALLPINGDVADPATMAFDELLGLHEHATGA